MPLQPDHQIISVDDHLIEHPRVWTDRLPAKLRDVGPHIVESDGNRLWMYEGKISHTTGLNAVAGKPRDEWGFEPLRYEDMIPGCYDPVARVRDMDLDGVQAAVCYPSFPGFAGGAFFRAKDKDVARLCVQAWNDFYIDEWCASAPDRFIPMGILPFWDIDLAVAEARRIIDKGARTISFPDSPQPLGLPSFYTRHWDPLWALLSEADVPVSLHFGSGSFVPGFPYASQAPGSNLVETADVPFVVSMIHFSSNLMWTTVDLLFSRALQRFPNLKFLLAEGGIGWIPYLLERCDYGWDRHRWYQDVDRDTPPSELFRRHFFGCFIDDEHGVKNRHEIGVERMMIEVDYPHSDSSWPDSRKRASEVLADVPDDEVAQIVESNARRILHFPRS